MNLLREELGKADALPLVIADAATTTRSDVLAQADALALLLREEQPASILVQTDDPGRLVAALIACVDCGVNAIIASASYGAEVREGIVASLNMDSVLPWSVDDQVLELPASFQHLGQDGGRIYSLTSGTTSTPKLVEQRLSTLLSRVQSSVARGARRDGRWLMTYLPASFAGFQVVLTAVVRGALVVPACRSAQAFAEASRRHEVTHISGTPTFWRSFMLASVGVPLPSLRQITLGGEAVDQATLDHLKESFPTAKSCHVYGSTEGGVIFSVTDGREGFPADWLTTGVGKIELRIADGCLEVRTPMRMVGYANTDKQPINDEGWLQTNDLVEKIDDRVLFLGRRDDIINVGGLKLHPHEVESFLLGLSNVTEARVRAQESPITGQVVIAEIVISKGSDPEQLRKDVMRQCRQNLSDHKVPRLIRVVDSIPVKVSGKKA